MMDFNYIFLQEFGYILAAILFIFGLKMLGQESSAARGNLVSSIGMFLAILVTVTNIINPIEPKIPVMAAPILHIISLLVNKSFF